MSTPEPVFVRTREELLALGQRLDLAEEIAIDTEFHSERTYFAKLMLVQLATETELAVIDPLAHEVRPLLGPFLAVLARRNKTFIGHALDRDLELFLRTSGTLPARVFDTQVAAAFLGHGAQISLVNLLRARLGVDIDKLYSRADWGARPLPPAQLEYAIDDVRHMLALARSLRTDLEARGRSAWVEEESAPLLDPATHAVPDPAQAWLRVARRPAASTRAGIAVEALAAAREHLAQQLDEPARRILPDDLLVDLARRAPTNLDELSGETNRRSVPGLKQHGAIWLEALAAAAALPDREAPAEDASSPEQEALVPLTRLVVSLELEKRDLAAGLAPRDPDALVRASAKGGAIPLRGWRAEVLEAPLAALLGGRTQIRVDMNDGGRFVAVSESGAQSRED